MTTPARGAFGWLDRILLVGGVLLFGFLLVELGVREVWANLTLVGWGVALIIAQEILAYGANTAGWYAAFTAPRPSIPARRLLAARIVGDAVNYLTPTAGLGGEFARARFLRDYASPTTLAASVSVAKLSQFAGQALFVVIGLALVLPYTPLPDGVQHGMTIALLAIVLLIFGLLCAQRRGMFGPLLRSLQRIGFVREHHELGARLAQLDSEIARFHLDGSLAFGFSTLAFAVGWALGMLEMALMLWLLDIEVTLARVLAIEVLSIAIDGMLFFVPAKAGTQEAGKVFIFTLLGLDPAKGLALGILRRIRELTWAGVGMALWWQRAR